MKHFNKFLSVLLAVIFCVSALAVTAAALVPEKDPRETFFFGYYPQTEVTNPKVIQALTATKPNANGSVTYEGETYVPLTVEGVSIPGGGNFAWMYGYYPEMVYWFKMEPIEWLVLHDDANGKLLFAKNVLDTHNYNNTVRNSVWESSDVRAWLNDVFYNMAFTAKERRYILDSALKNEGNPIMWMDGAADTTDKVFLPSFAEITNKDYGFNTECDTYDDFGRYVGYYECYDRDTRVDKSGRLAVGTDLAKAKGVWANFTDQENMIPEQYCRYWLRTVGKYNTYTTGVLEDGRVSAEGWPTNYTIMGIRPMLRVAANAVIDNRDGSQDVPTEQPFEVVGPEGEVRYKEKVQFVAPGTNVTWSSSDPRIAEIDPVTGEVTMHRAGTVTIKALSDTGEVVEVNMQITYAWWQQLIRIVLFGWIWY
ncbi:MAG: Ig-like domain-containing protein [Clostridia bacterium]|nr:Ig-like domain-containing protein [Clostridia bacterium]